MYFYGWVVMSVRKEIKSMCDDCNLQKDHLLTFISHLGRDNVSSNLHTGGVMYSIISQEKRKYTSVLLFLMKFPLNY